VTALRSQRPPRVAQRRHGRRAIPRPKPASASERSVHVDQRVVAEAVARSEEAQTAKGLTREMRGFRARQG
jgi:hypothetical protein